MNESNKQTFASSKGLLKPNSGGLATVAALQAACLPRTKHFLLYFYHVMWAELQVPLWQWVWNTHTDTDSNFCTLQQCLLSIWQKIHSLHTPKHSSGASAQLWGFAERAVVVIPGISSKPGGFLIISLQMQQLFESTEFSSLIRNHLGPQHFMWLPQHRARCFRGTKHSDGCYTSTQETG